MCFVQFRAQSRCLINGGYYYCCPLECLSLVRDCGEEQEGVSRPPEIRWWENRGLDCMGSGLKDRAAHGVMLVGPLPLISSNLPSTLWVRIRGTGRGLACSHVLMSVPSS